ncbi:TcpE family conjugal transfer membrane protein [Actinomadura algeriensis]|uniref:MinD-like ATPase involved in chromosome partitioning or flagellar assembly n=1 Tax=Actinomadura algeriensis TaxID=1679523 RepID=A0ABR9JUC3_9ACTN|nr:TcpE family conjugal transfer membrane protein [Actinomadura algeriensis]MBE1534162.1 MinD-like ATPase involved in chromosome partitioning or flagellar assembly [Actinomadura algeriensis]
MDLPTYTNIWRIEKRLYKLYDLRLPMPLPLVQIGVFLGIFVPWIVMLQLVGVPFESPWHVFYIVPPGVLTWLATRPVIEGKRLTELLLSQGRYLAEPRTWGRLTPIREPREVVIVARVWRRPGTPAPAPERVAVPSRPKASPAPEPVFEAPRPEAPPATPRLEKAPAPGKRGLVSGVRRPGSPGFSTAMAPAVPSGGEPGDKKVAGTPAPPPATRPDIPMVPGTFGEPEPLVNEAQPRHPAAPAPQAPPERPRPPAEPTAPTAQPPQETRPSASAVPTRPSQNEPAAPRPEQPHRPAAFGATRPGEPAQPPQAPRPEAPAPQDRPSTGEPAGPGVQPPSVERPAAASGPASGAVPGGEPGRPGQDERGAEPRQPVAESARVEQPQRPAAFGTARPSEAGPTSQVPRPVEERPSAEPTAPTVQPPQAPRPEAPAPQDRPSTGEPAGPGVQPPSVERPAAASGPASGAVPGGEPGRASQDERAAEPPRVAQPQRPAAFGTARPSEAGPALQVPRPVEERPSAEPTAPTVQPPQESRPAAPAANRNEPAAFGSDKPGEAGRTSQDPRPVAPAPERSPQVERPAAASRGGVPGGEPGRPSQGEPVAPRQPGGDPVPPASAGEPPRGGRPERPAAFEGGRPPQAESPRTFGRAPGHEGAPAPGHQVPGSSQEGWPPAPDEAEAPRLEAPRPWSKGLSQPARPAATDAQMWPPVPEPAAPQDEEPPPRDVRSGPQSPVRPRPLPPPPAPPPSGPAITPPGPEHEVSAGGLRRLFQAVGGGHGDVDAEYQLRLQQPFRGTRHVVVLGCTGGAGQTVTALMLGHTFAQHNAEPVVAIDVNPGPGALARRTRSETNETLTGLITRADQVGSLTAMRRYTSQAKSGLDVIAAGKNPLQALDDRDYALAIRTIDRFYSVTLLDTAAAVVARVLPYADQLVLVAPASNDAPRAVAMTYEWLDGHGYEELRSRAVTVINGVSRRSMDDVEQAEAVARGRCRALVRIPWDDHLSMDRAPRNELKSLRAPTRRAYLALAGVVAGGFGVVPERYQEFQQEQEQEATR